MTISTDAVLRDQQACLNVAEAVAPKKPEPVDQAQAKWQ